MENATDSPPQITLGGLESLVARRVDATTGTTEEVEFFGSDSLKMFGCTYLPAGRLVAGVVICPPVEAEIRGSYRREVLLARSLVARGLAVQRFHYRGSGHSEGEPDRVSLKTMQQDAVASAEHLMRRAGVQRVAFVGTRWGALVAATAAQGFDGAPLALWDPTVDASRYFREILRGRLMQEMKKPKEGRPTTEALVEEIRQRGYVDAMGYTVYKDAFESGVGHGLLEAIGKDPRAILMTQIGPEPDLSRDYEDVCGQVRSLGFRVETRVIEDEAEWWMGRERWLADESNPGIQKLLDETADWLIGRLSGESTP